MMSGITEPVMQRNIIHYMIDELNFMFAEIAVTSANVYHIDCRGVAQSADDWYDELHLKSKKYGQVARAYEDCIDSETSLQHQGPKIFFAKNYQ
jgi:hypothetical protein